MTTTVSIPARCNGPADSGNGGYSCGLLAAFIDGPARVRLHAPPPLETDLRVCRGQHHAVEMFDGERLVGAAWPAELALDIPPAPSLAEASEASSRFLRYRDHDYPSCYVCGPERRDDGLCLFPGPVRDWQLLACTWQPRPDMLDDAGRVRPEIIWAALDCPGYFAASGPEKPLTLLGELTAEIFADITGTAPLVVFCWPLGREGRKAWGGTAIADASGEVLAASRSLWISLKG